MNREKVILFVLLVVPGTAAAIASAWWGINDFKALMAANQNFQKLAERGGSQSELFVMAHRENTHRINVGFDGTWVLLGGILAGIGILGIVEVDKE